jgi:hypothetical protein
MGEASPEKAGVGGSTPSLATTSFSDLADRARNVTPVISHLWSLGSLSKRLSNILPSGANRPADHDCRLLLQSRTNFVAWF